MYIANDGVFAFICCIILFFSLFSFSLLLIPPLLTLEIFIDFIKPTENLISVLGFSAVRIYINPSKERELIFLDNKNRSGIYCWYNKINNQLYIGSAIKLTNRINDYFQISYQRDKAHLPIIRALKKYGIDSFILYIIEYTECDDLLIREQFWLDSLQPKYNILKEAGNSAGFKHSEESKDKMKLKKIGFSHSLETREQMSLSRIGINNSFFGKTHSEISKNKISEFAKNRIKDPNPGTTIFLTSSDYTFIQEFKSIREASRSLKADTKTINKYLDQPKLFRKKYYILSVKPN